MMMTRRRFPTVANERKPTPQSIYAERGDLYLFGVSFARAPTRSVGTVLRSTVRTGVSGTSVGASGTACQRPPRRRRTDAGASLVEFALILPIFMMILVGFISSA